MKVRTFWLLLAAVVLAGCIPASAAIDKAVYRDENYALSWVSAEVADMITDYLVSKGYKKLNAQGFREFCIQHSKDRATSVVVMANDVVPDTVADPVGDTNSPNLYSTLNKYLYNGGKLIYLFDWPAYYVGLNDGSRPAWNDTGAAAAFGFWVARWGYNDANTPVVFNDEAKKWGFTKPWNSARATAPSDVDIVLGYPQGHTDWAMPWVKTYVWGRPGAGMLYLYDLPASTAVNNGFNEEDLAQIDRVATYFPAGETKLYGLEGTVTDESGKPVGGGKVRIVGPEGSREIPVWPDGTFSTAVPAGDYSVVPIGETAEPVTPANVTVKDSTVTVQLKVRQVLDIDLSTASTDTTVSAKAWGGIDNPVLVRPDNFDPAKPDFKETAEWMDVQWPADLQAGNPVPNNSWFWYRIKFRMPASMAQYKGRPFVLWNFQVDDSDITFFNGHYIGHMMWSWDTSRRYIIPAEYINWDGDNVIAILGNQGGGGAGSQNRAGRLHPVLSSFGVISGRVVTETGAGAARMTVTLTDAAGKSISTSTSDFDGSFVFEVAPGTYKLSVKGYAASVPAPVDVTVEGGKSVVLADLKITGAGFGPADFPAVDVSKLKGEDINTDGGSTSVSGNVVTINADGADIWDVADQFHYAYLPTKVNGDFTAAVRVLDTAQGGSDWSKAGIMVRDTTEPGSVHVFAAGTGMHGARLQWRPVADAASNDLGGDNWWKYGTWIMLVRKGNLFTMYKSEDGSNPVKVAETTVADMPSSLLIGLAATSHAAGDVRVAKFADFKLASVAWEPKYSEPSVTPPPPAVVLGDVNGDGKLGIPDATIALQIAVGILKNPTAAQITAGDINKNGKIDIADVTRILRAAVGLEKLS